MRFTGRQKLTRCPACGGVEWSVREEGEPDMVCVSFNHWNRQRVLDELERIGCDVANPTLVALVRNWEPVNKGTSDWSESSFACWCKIQAINMGLFPEPGKRLPNGDCVTAIMHCFFIALEETPEMLERLRRSELVLAAERNNPARSKLGEQVEVLRPIDRTAARVVKQP